MSRPTSARTTRLLALLPLAFVAVSPGCGSSDTTGTTGPADLCLTIAESSCELVYECLSPAEIEDRDLPATEAGCIRQLSTELGCATATEASFCDGRRFDPNAARACADDFAGFTCSVFPEGPSSVNCDRVCGPDTLGQSCTIENAGACGLGNKCASVLKNTLTGLEALECVPDGDRGRGGECERDIEVDAFDNCEAGLTCWDRSCLSQCQGDNDCAVGSEACVAATEFDAVGACATRCQVLESECGPGLGCYAFGLEIAICRPAGGGEAGDFCEVRNDCQPRHTCFADGACSQLCDLEQFEGQEAPNCPAGNTCVGIISDRAAFDGVGACVF